MLKNRNIGIFCNKRNYFFKMKKNLPSFSIIIPTRNRADNLEETLRRIESITYQGKWEVIIVNNNSADRTDQVVQRFLKRNRHFSLIKEEKEGISFVRNTGIKKSRYNHILFIDDDISVERKILIKFSSALINFPEATAIGGKIVGDFMENRLRYYKLFFKHLSWVFALTERKNDIEQLRYPDLIFSACICLRRNKLGKEMFNTMLGRRYGKFFLGAEDLEFCLRLLYRGHVFIYIGSIVVNHRINNIRFSILYLVKRFIQTGIENKLVEKILYQQNIPFSSWDWNKNNLKDALYCIFHFQDIPARLVQIFQILLFIVGYNLYEVFLKMKK